MGNSTSSESRLATLRAIESRPNPSGLQLPDNPFAKERIFEDLFLHGAVGDGEIPPTLITRVLFRLDSDDDLQVLFETSTHSYGFFVILANISNLSWKECQAITDVMKLSEKGTRASNEMFAQWYEALTKKYGSVKLAQGENRLVIVIKPESTSRCFGEGNIMKCSFSEGNGDVKLKIFTGFFTADIKLSTPFSSLSSPPGLSIQDCQCLAIFFNIFETGDSMSEDQFMAVCANLTKNFNHVSLSKTGSTYELIVRPTIQDDLCLISPLLIRWIEAKRLADAPKRSVPSHPHPLSQAKDETSRWRCDAPAIYGNCISGITDFEKGKGVERWRCVECNFDLCVPCLNRSAPQSPAAKVTSPSTGQYPSYSGVTITSVISSNSGQAVVYRGTFNKTQQAVAIKVYKEQNQWDECKTELKVLLKLGDHPNVVSLVDFFESPLPCVVMQLIDGQTLYAHLGTNGAFQTQQGIQLAIGIASGLNHLHQGRFIHRDVKSLNIMIDQHRNPVLIDMGLGKETRETQTHAFFTTNPKGTLCYLAPEMYLQGLYSTATDVYAFGIVLWEIFSGHRPYDDSDDSFGLMMQKISASSKPLRPSLSALPPGLDRWLIDLMQICWHPSPEFRPRMDRILASLRDPSNSDFGIARAEAAFKEADTKKTGRLTIDQFSVFLRQIEPSLADDQARRIFEFVDADNSNTLELPEFLKFWNQLDDGGIHRILELSQKRVSNPEIVRPGPSIPALKLETADIRDSWGIDEVIEALNREGLSQYVPAFLENKVHGQLLKDLTDDEYIEMGVNSSLHRSRIKRMHLPTSISFASRPSTSSSRS